MAPGRKPTRRKGRAVYLTETDKAQAVINSLEGAPGIPELIAIYAPEHGWMYYEGGFSGHLSPRVWLSAGRSTQVRFTSFVSKYKNTTRMAFGTGHYQCPVSDWRVMNLATGQTWSLEEYRELFLAPKRRTRKKAA